MSDSLKVPKLFFRFLLRAANSLAASIRRSLSVLCLWVLSIVRLLSLVCVNVERSHVFSLRAEEKDLSPAALVAGFTGSVHYTLTVWSRGKQLVLFSRVLIFPEAKCRETWARGKTKLTSFPRDHTLSVLLYKREGLSKKHIFLS